MKMIDEHQRVSIQLTYAEAERMYIAIDMRLRPEFYIEMSEKTAEPYSNLLIKMQNKLDEYINT